MAGIRLSERLVQVLDAYENAEDWDGKRSEVKSLAMDEAVLDTVDLLRLAKEVAVEVQGAEPDLAVLVEVAKLIEARWRSSLRLRHRAQRELEEDRKAGRLTR